MEGGSPLPHPLLQSLPDGVLCMCMCMCMCICIVYMCMCTTGIYKYKYSVYVEFFAVFKEVLPYPELHTLMVLASVTSGLSSCDGLRVFQVYQFVLLLH